MKTKCNQKYLKKDDMMKIVCVISKKENYVFCNLSKYYKLKFTQKIKNIVYDTLTTIQSPSPLN